MKTKTMLKKLSAILLIAALVLSWLPVAAFAEDGDDGIIVVDDAGDGSEEDPEIVTGDPNEGGDPTDGTVPGEGTDPGENTDPDGEDDPTDVIPGTDDVLPEDEVTEGEEEPEEPEEAEELPYGFPGMPEGYTVSAEDLEEKAALVENDLAATVAGLTPGTDYVDNQIVYIAYSQEEAEAVAAAYGAVLVSYDYDVAVAELTDATVAEAIEVSQDASYNMPVVSPNFIYTVEPNDGTDRLIGYDPVEDAPDAGIEAVAIPKPDTWVDYKDGDPFLKDPAVSTGRYQWQHDMVNSYEAWSTTTGKSSVIVAVLDSGCNNSHTELTGVTVRSTQSFTGLTDDDKNGHGTHVCGIIGAKLGNGIGGSGIAPTVKIYSYNVLPRANGSGESAWITAGINKAVQDGAWIISMSLGGPFYDAAYNKAIQNAYAKNVTVIAAMGNDGSNTKCYPAGYAHVIAVAAVDRDGKRAYFSNYGSWADIAAPGVDILSTCTTAYENSFTYSGQVYGFMSGTSQATPAVSAAAALYMSVYGRVAPGTMENILKSRSNKAKSSGTGAGILNIEKMFSQDRKAPQISLIEGAFLSIQGNGNDDMIIYTLGTAKPVVKNGVVTRGEVYTGTVDLSANYSGKTVTVNALCITAQGTVGKVATAKVKVALVTAKSIVIEGSSKITGGTTAKYVARVTNTKNVVDANQKVTWSISSRTGSVNNVKINSKTGALTTQASSDGTVVIQATSTNKSTVYKRMTVTIVKGVAIKTVKLNKAKATLKLAASNATKPTVQLSVAKLINVKDKNVTSSLSSYGVKWTSSNTKVATVSSSGLVTAVGKGTATIKCTVSGKTGTCKITVRQLVTSLSISGSNTVSVGHSIKLTAVTNADASNKNVNWIIDGIGGNIGVTISSDGVLKVKNDTLVNSYIRILASAKDGSGVYATKNIYIRYPVKNVSLSLNGSPVTSVKLYTRKVTGGLSSMPQTVTISRSFTGNSAAPYEWKSSNTKVATVDQNGKITAVSGGDAVITCRALDGSGKKASVKVKVVCPASYIKISSNRTRFYYSNYFVAAGKTATHTVTYGDTYGKPNVKSVTWSFTVKDWYGNDVTSTFKSKGLVKLSSKGTLTLAAGMKNYEGYYVTVTAKANDGSNATDSIEYYVTTARKISKYYVGYTTQDGQKFAVVYIRSASQIPPSATSSNPKVASYWKYQGYDSSLKCHVYVFASNGKGTATLTFKMQDGSGKKCTVKVKF